MLVALIVLGFVCATNLGGAAEKFAAYHRSGKNIGGTYSARTTGGVRATGVAFMVLGLIFMYFSLD